MTKVVRAMLGFLSDNTMLTADPTVHSSNPIVQARIVFTGISTSKFRTDARTLIESGLVSTHATCLLPEAIDTPTDGQANIGISLLGMASYPRPGSAQSRPPSRHWPSPARC